MKIRNTITTLFLSCLLLFQWAHSQYVNAEFRDGKLYFLVHSASIQIPEFNENTDPYILNAYPEIQSLINEYQISSIKRAFSRLSDPVLDRAYSVYFDTHEKGNELMTDLKEVSFVEYVEMEPLYKVDHTPNDFSESAQWYIDTIQGRTAWDISTGSEEIVIAITDDAVFTQHEDLNGNIWVNPGEIPNNNVDDDGNGYVDDVNGYDVSDNDEDPRPPTGADDLYFGHGTHVAGCASAVANNDLGLAGIGYKTKLMAVKCKSNFDSSDFLTNPYDGIEYAIAAGADVINCSWGSTSGPSPILQAIFNAGHSQGIVFVASAGNSGENEKHYPSGYNHVICVAASGNDDKKAGFSTYHETVDVMAPGEGIYSTIPDESSGGYGNQSGTSMSSPITAGVCALMLSVNPTLTPDELETCLKSSCKNVDDLNPDYLGLFGAGRIDAYAAIQCVPALAPPVTTVSYESDTVCGGKVQFYSDSENFATDWTWNFGDGGDSSDERNPEHTFENPGTYTVEVIAMNNAGSDTASISIDVTILELPVVNPSPLKDSACVGATIQLHAEGGVDYLWVPANGLSDETVSDPIATVLSSITYIVTVVASNGCEAEDTVTLKALPAPQPWAGGSSITVEAGCDSVQLNGFADNPVWSPDYGLSCTECADPMALPDTTTEYTLTSTGENGCSGTDNITVVNDVCVGRTSLEVSLLDVKLFPNPAEDHLSIEFTLKQPSSVELEILDVHGKTLYTLEKTKLGVGEHRQLIELENYTAGLYILLFNAHGQIAHSKFMVNN